MLAGKVRQAYQLPRLLEPVDQRAQNSGCSARLAALRWASWAWRGS